MKRIFLLFLLAGVLGTASVKAQPAIPAGQVDIFMGVDLNYRDLLHNGRVYDFLINLTPGIKWNMGKGWQATAQAFIPVYNNYGDRYKKVRLTMAVLSKEMSFRSRWYLKASGGLFGSERYGLDLKGMYVVNDWLALEAQAGWTGYCSMAAGWEASLPKRLTALAGADFYLSKWNTQFRVRGGRFVYEDYGAIVEAMRHFRHCTVGVYGEYSNEGGKNAGFKVVMMIPPYKRHRRKVNFRPASNFRLTYSLEGDAYANKMYATDPEENEREGWFDREALKWGSNTMEPDFENEERKMKNEECVQN
ncbi:hypothetical protein Bacsa_2767 [Phocaeicola salanitronis DSM 18170]|uniref:Uncharacterized protein n=1 Tax=Phocaeicola salanitronis (strain DSM 18170 / JCM 13657 / CCUG 60908 / BL78) TaxID=667015 RepID=F0R0F6_PHOSB|nr:hypothetical protein [Phocaeicola salanitronis]ADY37300.1 hypothetical protein Bacsa_2767 [Phocaeicola salanitronis DSM 18170]